MPIAMGSETTISTERAPIFWRWPDILAGKPDFLKIYLERSEHHTARRNDAASYGKRGLDPTLVSAIVERAHAAGLRVAAHVTSRYDFRATLEADVDEIQRLAALRVFGRSELLRMLVIDTPRWISPTRNLGTLNHGSEASFVVLAANPLEELEALKQITSRYKAGHALEIHTARAEEKPGIGQTLVQMIMSRGVDKVFAGMRREPRQPPCRR